jgi:hypothetical protein
MTIAEQFETARLARQLWEAVLPDMEAPPAGQFIRWLRFGEGALAHAINRAAAKRLRCVMTTEDVSRYVTSVAAKESKQERERV